MSSAMPDPFKCQWCGGFHQTKCPMVKAIEYNQDGTTKRVEFYAPNDYPKLDATSLSPPVYGRGDCWPDR